MVLKILLGLTLLFILYQDLRYRAVYWVIFPVLLFLLGFCKLQEKGWEVLIESSLVNLAFLASQLVLLSLYFSLKKRNWVNITRGYLGWGDILFLLVLAFYLSPLNYFAFYFCSLLLSLLISFPFLQREGDYKIPLAGLQAAFFLLVLLVNWNITSFDLMDDRWLIRFMTL